MVGGFFLGAGTRSTVQREAGQRFELALLNLVFDCEIHDSRRKILVCQPPPTSAVIVSYSRLPERVASVENSSGITYGDIWDAFRAVKEEGKWTDSHSYGLGWTSVS